MLYSQLSACCRHGACPVCTNRRRSSSRRSRIGASRLEGNTLHGQKLWSCSIAYQLHGSLSRGTHMQFATTLQKQLSSSVHPKAVHVTWRWLIRMPHALYMQAATPHEGMTHPRLIFPHTGDFKGPKGRTLTTDEVTRLLSGQVHQHSVVMGPM